MILYPPQDGGRSEYDIIIGVEDGIEKEQRQEQRQEQEEEEDTDK